MRRVPDGVWYARAHEIVEEYFLNKGLVDYDQREEMIQGFRIEELQEFFDRITRQKPAMTLLGNQKGLDNVHTLDAFEQMLIAARSTVSQQSTPTAEP